MIVESSVDEILVAIETALDPALIDVDDYAGVFHEGQVPEGAGIRRVIVRGYAEPRDAERGIGPQKMGEQVTTIGVFGESFGDAFELYRAVAAALHGVMLPLASHRMVYASLSRTTDFPDPDPDVRAHQVVTEYRTRTVPA